jgi:hypothetical protein
MSETELVPPKVNPAKRKKKARPSLHRENKTEAHTTINGKGRIARISGGRI